MNCPFTFLDNTCKDIHDPACPVFLDVTFQFLHISLICRWCKDVMTDMSIFMLKIDISRFSVDHIDMKAAYVDFLIEFRHI